MPGPCLVPAVPPVGPPAVEHSPPSGGSVPQVALPSSSVRLSPMSPFPPLPRLRFPTEIWGTWGVSPLRAHPVVPVAPLFSTVQKPLFRVVKVPARGDTQVRQPHPHPKTSVWGRYGQGQAGAWGRGARRSVAPEPPALRTAVPQLCPSADLGGQSTTFSGSFQNQSRRSDEEERKAGRSRGGTETPAPAPGAGPDSPPPRRAPVPPGSTPSGPQNPQLSTERDVPAALKVGACV